MTPIPESCCQLAIVVKNGNGNSGILLYTPGREYIHLSTFCELEQGVMKPRY